MERRLGPGAASRNGVADRTAFTRGGAFAGAIPHPVLARWTSHERIRSEFNLALCYVGERQFGKAIETLSGLRNSGHENAERGESAGPELRGRRPATVGLRTLLRATSRTPTNEKLYLFVGTRDGCHDYAFGLKVVELGLKILPIPRTLISEACFCRCSTV